MRIIQIILSLRFAQHMQYSNINISGMSRHRRVNSDLFGLKSIKCMKVQSCKETQTVLKNHNMSAYDTKTSQSKKPNCPQTPSKKVEAHEMILDTFKLVKHFYQTEETEYFARVKRYLHGQWESHKKNFNEHLNKLIYMEEEMQKKNYHEIQLEIIGQWRKNPVLYCIRVFWYELIGSIKFQSIGDFMKRYNLFKDFIGQLAYLYFKRFFKSLGSQKQISKVLDKLSQRSSHLIISYTSSWCKLCDRVVIPLLKSKIQTSIPNLQNMNASKFNLEKLNIKSIAVDYKAVQLQMPKTTNSIDKFIFEHKILQKIKLLIDVRQHMEEEIRARQQHLIQAGHLKEIKILDKDDFVDCLIYCMVRGDISLENLGLSIKFLYYILGPDTNTILSKFRCDSYLADFEAVFDFLVQDITSENNKKQVKDPITSQNSPA